MNKCGLKLECAWHRLSTVDKFVVVYEFLLTSNHYMCLWCAAWQFCHVELLNQAPALSITIYAYILVVRALEISSQQFSGV